MVCIATIWHKFKNGETKTATVTPPSSPLATDCHTDGSRNSASID